MTTAANENRGFRGPQVCSVVGITASVNLLPFTSAIVIETPSTATDPLSLHPQPARSTERTTVG